MILLEDFWFFAIILVVDTMYSLHSNCDWNTVSNLQACNILNSWLLSGVLTQLIQVQFSFEVHHNKSRIAPVQPDISVQLSRSVLSPLWKLHLRNGHREKWWLLLMAILICSCALPAINYNLYSRLYVWEKLFVYFLTTLPRYYSI